MNAAADAFGWAVEHWPVVALGIVAWTAASVAVAVFAGRCIDEGEEAW